MIESITLWTMQRYVRHVRCTAEPNGDVVARLIHGASPRADRPFVPFNCTALPRDLVWTVKHGSML